MSGMDERPRAGFVARALQHGFWRFRAVARSSEPVLAFVAACVGAAAALGVAAMTQVATLAHRWIYHLPFDVRLSASDVVSPTAAFGALLLGGVLLGLSNFWLKHASNWRAIDPIEANALLGGRMSLRDSLIVAAQTVVSNGVGASVGLEAGYAQWGAGLASWVGQHLGLRRRDLRLLVGAGAAAAIGGAFGAPLTGAFYAFELIVGSYSIAAAGPIFAAAIAGAGVSRLLTGAPYQIEMPMIASLRLEDYPALMLLAAIACLFGVAAMRLAGSIEKLFQQSPFPVWSRPAIGGLLLAPLALYTPQMLGAGHGALSLDIGAQMTMLGAATLLAVKLIACLISLGSGFRGGLFFASLFMGVLLGKIYAMGLIAFAPSFATDTGICILGGMATLSAVIVGGPLTMSFLVLEGTGNFSVTAGVLTASIAASLVVRASFGFSFSTWRLHLRGENIRSANDISWSRALTVGRLMTRDPPSFPASLTLAEMCDKFPPGSAQAVIAIDENGRYAGLANLSEAQIMRRDEAAAARPLAAFVKFKSVVLRADMDAKTAMAIFDKAQADQLAVVDPAIGAAIGLLGESHLARRYAEELDAAARDAMGE